jgi:hypothetical protein
MERVMTAVVIHRAPLAMRRILLDSGPPILKTLTVTNEARLQTQPGPGDTKGPHFEGRALDIFLFAARPAELDVGENLVEFLLNRQDEIKWSTLIYFKREWSSKDSMIPRIGTQGRDFEHKTHIHIEWAARDRDFDDFKDAMAQQLEVVFGPNPYDE